ncbi:MAG TPA: hypothetical protein VKP65_06465, partial [Rhodothermales bacterium]|nr:hypothetical protein [Rhodothermales bacterium]
MLENILISVIFGATTAGLLEVWRRVRMRWAEEEGAEAATEQAGHPAWRTILRLLLATIIGFVMGGITAGLLEAMGVKEIAFGSFL